MKKTKENTTNIAYLSDVVQQNDYFQRSVNIDLDSNTIQAIENFYCPISYEQVLIRMANFMAQTKQSAFTWTGSYGSGKSSLALFLQALVSPDKEVSVLAKDKLSQENARMITQFFDGAKNHWHIINLVGRAVSPEYLVKEYLFGKKNVSTQDIFDKLSAMTDGDNRLIIFLDELGKTLEAVNRSEQGDDIYFLQQLAEFVNRSQGKIIFIGILHQSFTAYARQAKKQIYHEWLKIQGRFVDCAITLSVDEQLYLISKVIKLNKNANVLRKKDDDHHKTVQALVANIAENKHIDNTKLMQVLLSVFPLNPLVAILLCQLSKKNFGQNQRSIFSFLMSAEPYGFGYYLRQTRIDDFSFYEPEMLWDYIDSNLGNMILASEYAKVWLLSQMAISRYQVKNDELAVRLIKVISLLSLLTDDTGVHGDIALLSVVLSENAKTLQNSLTELESSGLIFYSKFKQAFLLNEGSDFNLDRAIEEQIVAIGELSIHHLKRFSPIIAKRHYQDTGNLRWAEIKLIFLNNNSVDEVLHKLSNQTDASCVGYLCVLVPTNDNEYADVVQKFKGFTKKYPNLIITIVEKYGQFIELLKDSLAIKEILKSHERLINDHIARQETEIRLMDIEDKLDVYLQDLLNHSKWYHQKYVNGRLLNGFLLSGAVSDMADAQVYQTIYCNNELVNRNMPSPNAKGAIRELIKRMIENSKEALLGIEKYPPERAIYESVLKNNGIHKSDDGENFYFSYPNQDSSFYAVWQCTDEFIAQKQGGLIGADEIYQLWQKKPFGIKAGLCDILYVAYIISRSRDLANYIEGEYKPNLQYLLAEYLLKSPKDVGIREVSSLKNQQQWIYQLKESLQKEFCGLIAEPIDNEPLPIAQALVLVFDKLPSYLQRTNELSSTTKQLRNILKQSNDPNKLLFDDLPNFFAVQDSDEQKANRIIDALKEMHDKYPKLVSEINTQLFINLKIIQPNEIIRSNDETLFDIVNNRANGIWKKTGDLTLEPFITRLRTYRGTPSEAEGLIGILAHNKPAKSWIDQDIHKAFQQLNILSFNFLEAEINTNTPVSDNRYKVSVILKSPNHIDSIEVQSDGNIKRNAHIVPQNSVIIDNIVAEMSSLDSFQMLDSNDKIATLARLFEQLAMKK